LNRIDIICSTRNRPFKLGRMLATIPREAEGTQVYIKVICDGDQRTYDTFPAGQRLETFYSAVNRGATVCRNSLLKHCEDAIIYAVDDMIFKPGSIAAAIRTSRARFRDDDFVIGFYQEGNTFNPAGVALVGQTFLRRYPEKALFFPGYFHFACQEVHAAAVKLGKFYLATDAHIYHFHPGGDPKQTDQTHHDARKHKGRDMKLKEERKAKGLIWGING